MSHLTQKERSLLQDQLSHEAVCISKYENYARQARDPQLQKMFYEFASQEQEHYNTLQGYLQGQASQGESGRMTGMSGMAGNAVQNQTVGQRQAAGQSQAAGQTQAGAGTSAGMTGQGDAMLANDMLMTEKYVSGAYDTAIFEFADMNIRQGLQHIQKEEQQHGEGLFNYMNQHGMYQVQ